MRNANYKILFRDPVDDLQMRTISSQLKWKLKGGCGSFLTNCMDYLVKNYPDDIYPYILVDGAVHTGMKELRCRSNIFPMDDGKIRPICFMPNPKFKK